MLHEGRMIRRPSIETLGIDTLSAARWKPPPRPREEV
jgi:hypothetical protein